MIPVARIRVLLALRYSAAYDLQGDIGALLPPDGLVLSGEEVARVREALQHGKGALPYGERWDSVRRAISLLDSAGEETG